MYLSHLDLCEDIIFVQSTTLLGLLLTCYDFLRPNGGLNAMTLAEKLGIKIVVE